MGAIMLTRLMVVGTLSLFWLASAKAADNKEGAACLLKCQTKLKQAGLWESYPRGHCRRQCDYFVGAPPDVRR
jgi:hypothetical protein